MKSSESGSRGKSLAGRLQMNANRGPLAAARRKIYGLVAATVATSLAVASPAMAAGSLGNAEKLRRLDIMLMVTSLRCRTTADNFTVEYGRFTTSHLAELNRANAQLRADIAARYGSAGADRHLDRLSTVMANAYGQGHPWLNCHELKMVTNGLAEARGQATLVEAADQLLET